MFGSIFCRFESSLEDVREEVLLEVPGFRTWRGCGAGVVLLLDVVEAFLDLIMVNFSLDESLDLGSVESLDLISWLNFDLGEVVFVGSLDVAVGLFRIAALIGIELINSYSKKVIYNISFLSV